MPWVLKRIGVSILLVWVVASIVFLAIRFVPGDPAELLLAQGGAAPDPSAVAELHEQLGLDRPLAVPIHRQHSPPFGWRPRSQPAG